MSLAAMSGASGLAACSWRRKHEEPEPEPEVVEEEPPKAEEVEWEPTVDLTEFEDLALNMDAWQYDEANDCYYQLALPYCINPGSEQYESLAVFVPGPYLQGTKKGRSYSCTVAWDAQVGQFTPQTAPVAMPINAPACGAQACPTTYSYDGLGRYLREGIVYVYAGFRGRSGGYESTTQEYFSGGAPWQVADLKAAVRFLRYNAAVLPCDTSRVFAFGLGGGGGVGSLLGVSGNAPAYEPYLQELGAATHDVQGNGLTDEIYGLASWCTIGSFESADAGYEWMMGQYDSTGTRAEGTWTKLLSADLADAYGSYVNELGLVDENGSLLQLDRIETGAYEGGSYYEYLVALISEAATDFIGRMELPYAAVALGARERNFPGDPSLGVSTASQSDSATEESSSGVTGVRQVEATVYDTLESYITTLNGDSRWLTYNASTGAVDVTGLWGFVSNCRKPDKDVCAFDHIDRSGLANQLFGIDDEPSLHFDAMVSQLIERGHERYAAAEGWDESLVAAWRGDLVELDTLELSVSDRVQMSDPLAFLNVSEDDDVQVGVAPHWRINTGLFQAETTLVGEVNLARALAAHERVADVAFQAVWGAGFEMAERTGDAEDNLIAWIASCCPQEELAVEDVEEEPAYDEEAVAQEELSGEEESAGETSEAATSEDEAAKTE